MLQISNLELPGCNQKLAPSTRRAMRASRRVAGGSNKQGNLHVRLVVGDCNASRPPRPPARIFKVQKEAFTGSSHMFRPDGLGSSSPSQGSVLGATLAMGTVGELGEYIAVQGQGMRWVRLPRSSSWVNWQALPL